MPRRASTLLCFVLVGIAGCDGCGKKTEPSEVEEKKKQRSIQCVSASECADDNPCTEETCSDSRCVVSYVEKGQSCDNETVCDGIAECDGKGHCRVGPPPTIDDGNPCTIDSCDPVNGPSHQPVAVDDGDECTKDSCNPQTGEAVHDPVDVDDGDDCTFDSCDPKHGPKHERPNPIYTCSESCGPGFHAASRTPRESCGPRGALQTFCVPSCGASFYQCETACSTGYHASARTQSATCGTNSAWQTFCEKNAGETFYSCDACPTGYRQEGENRAAHCGTTGTGVRCVKG